MYTARASGIPTTVRRDDSTSDTVPGLLRPDFARANG